MDEMKVMEVQEGKGISDLRGKKNAREPLASEMGGEGFLVPWDETRRVIELWEGHRSLYQLLIITGTSVSIGSGCLSRMHLFLKMEVTFTAKKFEM